MPMADVREKLGEPDQVDGREGETVWRYEIGDPKSEPLEVYFRGDSVVRWKR